MTGWYRFCQILSQVYFPSFFNLRVLGVHNVPRTGPVLLASNHQSYLDPVLATLALPRDAVYMAKQELFGNPVFRRLIESLGAFPIKQDSADTRAMREGLNRLKQGKALLVFPEGERTIDGSIIHFKAGFSVLARRAACPVVPMAIVGAEKAWHRRRRLFRFKPIRVVYGRAISAEEIRAMDRNEVAAIIRKRITKLKESIEAHPGWRG